MAASLENNSEKKFKKSYFDVLGLCCSSEVPLVERLLRNLDGVKDIRVVVPTKTVIVLHDSVLISELHIVKVLNQARLEASVRVQGVKSYQKKWPSPYAVACGVLVGLSFLQYVYLPFQWLALGAVAIGIIPVLLRAFTAIRNLTLDINILVIIAVAGSIVLKEYWEAGLIVFLFTIAEWLESRASHKATAAMSSLVDLVPPRAVLAETGEEVNVDEVKLNTLLAVKDGEIIPIDGVVVEGNCEVDQKTLTGESFPVSKQIGSDVFAGTINVNGYITVKTTALAEDCVVARMTKLVEEAQNNKSKAERYIDKCTKYYTPAIVVISACLAIVPAALRVHNRKHWYSLALVVLLSACPCALVLSTPVAMFCALTKAATSGVFFKGADYLETLANVKIMAFDKTGTITRAEFEVTEFKSFLEDISLSTVLYWVSSIESKSSHPLATALVAFAKSHKVEPKPDKVEQFQNFPGEGIYGKIDGKDIYIGNLKISSRAGSTSVPQLGDVTEGKAVGYIFLGSSPAGIFCLTDACRTGAKEALKELKSMGIQTVMLTGDSYAAAKQAHDQLEGELQVRAELLPTDKASIVKEFQKRKFTAMVGDGLNDAPALATADIGISMGISGSALATETGNIILMSNDIQRIPKVVRLARRAKRKVMENLFLSFITKGGIIALGIAGHPLVWASVLADVGTCVLVILNSMLLLKGMPEYGRKCCKSSVSSLANGDKNGGGELPHSHQPCCNHTKLQNCSKPEACSSKNCAPRHQSCPSNHSSCGTPKIPSCTDKKTCCGHGNQLHEAEYLELGSCSTGTGDVESATHHHEESNCSNLSKGHGDGTAYKEEHEHCHHENQKIDSWKDRSSRSSVVDHELTSCKQFEMTNCLNHTQNHPTADEEMLIDLVRYCCNKDSANNAHSECKNHAANSFATHHEILCNFGGHNHGSCKSINSCANLETRHVGACCESFRKECCIKATNFGDNFIGGLSEIVIE